jgi:transglutaminase-like putative cysteine protease
MVLAPTSLVLYEKTLPSSESLFNDGMLEFQRSNYGAASGLFNRSYQSYMSAGDQADALKALNMKLRADRVLTDFSFDRKTAEENLAMTFPWVPEEDRNSWLDDPSIEKIVSDGQERFFWRIAMNLAMRNLTLWHEWRDPANSTKLTNDMRTILRDDANHTGTYFNPKSYIANGVSTLERGILPPAGNLEIWVPAPIETGSQTDVSIISADPTSYVVTYPDVNGDLGQVYLNVPLDGLTSNVVFNITYSFTTYQIHYDIDPNNVGAYDKISPDYATYTASHDNIRITPEIVNEAMTVVGNETNPFLQAKLLYDYVVGNISYSTVPHYSLNARGIPESENVRIHRYGDCGAQSMYYSALLRSLGVPARTCGGFEMFGGDTGMHFWAEFFLPNYGWVPVDVTWAEAMDRIPLGQISDAERVSFKEYFFANLDPLRYTIQNDADQLLVPSPAMYYLLYAVFQTPMASCLGCEQDLPFGAAVYWQFKISAADG